MKYQIECSLHAGTTGCVELPEGRTWDDVATWYVKWDTLYATFKDGTQFDHDLNSDTFEVIDWKRPKSVEVYAIDEETGEVNHDKELE